LRFAENTLVINSLGDSGQVGLLEAKFIHSYGFMQYTEPWNCIFIQDVRWTKGIT